MVEGGKQIQHKRGRYKTLHHLQHCVKHATTAHTPAPAKGLGPQTDDRPSRRSTQQQLDQMCSSGGNSRRSSSSRSSSSSSSSNNIRTNTSLDRRRRLAQLTKWCTLFIILESTSVGNGKLRYCFGLFCFCYYPACSTESFHCMLNGSLRFPLSGIG